MIKLNRLLNLKTNFLFLLLLFAGCSRNEQKQDFVAKVNDSYLTEKDLTAISGGYGGQTFFKEEIIRDWVNTELLYQQALKDGIIESEEYRSLMNKSGKQLAASIMLKKLFSEKVTQYSTDELKAFYDQNPDIFRLYETAYIINTAEFTDENKAVMFRSAAVESDWNKALNFYNNDQSLSREENNRLLFAYDLQPLQMGRIINELNPGEVSLILPGEKNGFLVVKMVSKLYAGTIPAFEIIKEKVEGRYLAQKKSEMLKEYLEELYSSNQIEIKQ
jgi:hypothetical protein